VIGTNEVRLPDVCALTYTYFVSVMVFAGLDTTTSALARCIHLLAEHPHAQARLRSEVRDAMKSSAHEGHGGSLSAELPHDVLVNLPFLDGVVKETLRLYPTLPVMARRHVTLFSGFFTLI
jgi:cytochrome P450